MSTLYEETKDTKAAEKILLEGIKIFPKNVELLYALGVVYEKTDRVSESIMEMQNILKIDPEHADALNFIGYSYAERNINLEEAEKLIIKALQLKPDSGYIIDSLGWVHFKQNKLDSALTHLKKAMELLPDDYNIVEHLGDVYHKMSNIKKAREMYKRAIQLAPDNDTLKKKLSDLANEKK